MFSSIFIGMTGLLGYERGLRVIANDTANLNTPGYKSSNLKFTDLFYADGTGSNPYGTDGGHSSKFGFGMTTKGTTLNFQQGELRQTGNDLDLAIDGQGMFTLKDASGRIHYTRAGQFSFNADGVLVNGTDGAKVMALDKNNSLVEIQIADLRLNKAKSTQTISFNGNLLSTDTEQTVSGITVFDASGGEHTLSAKFTNTNATTPGSWRVELLDGTTVVGTGQIIFDSGSPTAATSKVSLTYLPAGQAAMPLVLDFSKDVTSSASSSIAALALTKQDGYGAGKLIRTTFDSTGTLMLTYANGQVVKGGRLALGRFDSADALHAIGNGAFDVDDTEQFHIGVADNDAFGKVNAGSIEISNVDLSQEFSDLVIMQRGYQASSQIISTANDMLQELFTMVGK